MPLISTKIFEIPYTIQTVIPFSYKQQLHQFYNYFFRFSFFFYPNYSVEHSHKSDALNHELILVLNWMQIKTKNQATLTHLSDFTLRDQKIIYDWNHLFWHIEWKMFVYFLLIQQIDRLYTINKKLIDWMEVNDAIKSTILTQNLNENVDRFFQDDRTVEHWCLTDIPYTTLQVCCFVCHHFVSAFVTHWNLWNGAEIL